MDEPLLLLHAYLDGELGPADSLAIAQQIAADPALGAEVEHIQALRHAVRERLPREPLPPDLRARIETAIGRRGPQVHPSCYLLDAKVCTCLTPIGSAWLAKTMGIVLVACRAGSTNAETGAKVWSTFMPTNSAAS